MRDATLPTAENAVERLLAQPWVAPVARIAAALPFLLSGLSKLADFGGAIAEVRGLTGLEPAILFAVLVIATQLVGSALLIAGGRFTWIGAGLLGGFTIVATLYAHAFWLKPEAERFLNRNIFFEHVSIVGGLALAAILSARGQQR
ncbi:DoxX family protein [Bosea thiooxidans]